MPAPEPIENHAVIGDLNTVALVALDGSIDFLCFPRFDSPTIFAALLDPDRGGIFRISPELNGARRKQLYLPNSNILLTRFLAQDGVVEISDFMPVGEVAPERGGAEPLVQEHEGESLFGRWTDPSLTSRLPPGRQSLARRIQTVIPNWKNVLPVDGDNGTGTVGGRRAVVNFRVAVYPLPNPGFSASTLQ